MSKYAKAICTRLYAPMRTWCSQGTIRSEALQQRGHARTRVTRPPGEVARCSLDVARHDGHVQVGRRRVVELGVLEIAELHGELDVDALLLDVILRERDGLD